jgi:hypothetical protein
MGGRWRRPMAFRPSSLRSRASASSASSRVPLCRCLLSSPGFLVYFVVLIHGCRSCRRGFWQGGRWQQIWTERHGASGAPWPADLDATVRHMRRLNTRRLAGTGHVLALPPRGDPGVLEVRAQGRGLLARFQRAAAEGREREASPPPARAGASLAMARREEGEEEADSDGEERAATPTPLRARRGSGGYALVSDYYLRSKTGSSAGPSPMSGVVSASVAAAATSSKAQPAAAGALLSAAPPPPAVRGRAGRRARERRLSIHDVARASPSPSRPVLPPVAAVAAGAPARPRPIADFFAE